MEYDISDRPAVGVANPEYGLKMILRNRPEVLTELWPSAERYLEFNGGRLVHPSRGFWRDRNGARCTLAKAEVAAGNYAPDTWVVAAA